MRKLAVRLFRSGGDQTIPIPPELAMPGREVVISKRGECLIIEPADAAAEVVPLDALESIEEDGLKLGDPQR